MPLWPYACGLDIILRLFFITFSTSWTQSFFRHFLPLKWIDSGYLVCATLLSVLFWFFWNVTGVLVMVWRCACGFSLAEIQLIYDLAIGSIENVFIYSDRYGQLWFKIWLMPVWHPWAIQGGCQNPRWPPKTRKISWISWMKDNILNGLHFMSSRQLK